MTHPTDGGPAFPLRGSAYDEDLAQRHEGLSLRDYYATHFAAAWTVALARRSAWPGLDESTVREAVRLGVLQADAMLVRLGHVEEEPQP